MNPILLPPADRLSPTQLARELGVHVGTVWRWLTAGVRNKQLPSILVGGRRYILRRDLAAFLAAGNAVDENNEQDRRARSDLAAAMLDASGVKAK